MDRMQVSPLGSLNLKAKIEEILSPEYGSFPDSGKIRNKRKKRENVPLKDL